MPYQVTFTQTNNPDKPAITVADGSVDQSTSLDFPGKSYTGYGSLIANDFLHLLENFANDTAPRNPVQGQLWFDTAAGVNLLKVFDGITWTPAGSLKKSGNAPAAANIGDLWVDTNTSQLYLYSGSNYVLVGPQFSSGLQTGPIVEAIVDTTNVTHSVISIYASGSNTTSTYRIAVISKDAFIPKAALSGFSSINQGINLSSVDSNNSANLSRFWGIAEKADALLVGTKTVSADNFLRGDAITTANFPINVRNDGGITIGSNLGFNIGVNGNVTALYSKNSGNSVEILTNNAGTSITSFHLSADSKLGLGSNNTNPVSTLDVIGVVTVKDDPSTQSIAWTSNTSVSLDTYITSNAFYYQVTVAGTTGTVSPSFTSGTATDGTATLAFIGAVPTAPVPGRLVVTGTTDVGATSTSPFDNGGASLQTLGGATIAKNVSIGANLTTGGKIVVGADINSVSIQPSVTGVYDIGSSTHAFRNVYAQTFQGNFSGTFSGSLTGSITGAAAKLQSPTTFLLAGDVTSPGIVFDGQTQTGTVTFDTSINQGIITSKTPATDSALTDSFLVYREGAGLISMTKQVLLSHVATMPIGCVMPYAGSPSNLPAGYLLCDGSEVKISQYPGLYAVIQYTYKPASLLVGLSTFALPDLRGRFPLGPDNMNNSLTVPSGDGSGIQISAGGGSANRVTNVTADTVGASSGNQTVSLDVTNLPDHRHSLNSGNAQYYAVGDPNSAIDAFATAGKGLTVQGQTGQGFGFNNSGSMVSATNSTPVNVMNPYTTMNYIIFTGAV